MNNINLLIPAAGKGSRTGLSYPKCLFKIDNIPIIVRTLKEINFLKLKPTVVVNPDFFQLFKETFNNYNIDCEILFQNSPKGMGDSVLKFKYSNNFDEVEHILLIWSDLIFVNKNSVLDLINVHLRNDNTFSFISKFVEFPYTYIEKDKLGRIMEIVETKELKKPLPKYGERDIGVFIFKKNIVFELLKKNLKGKFNPTSNEHGFLYVIKHLYEAGHKIEALRIAGENEDVSFNSFSDIEDLI